MSKTLGGPCGSLDTMTAIGVEAGAMLGALGFLVGTIMFAVGDPVGAYYKDILLFWMFGSSAFTTGSLFLGYRHFKMPH